MPLLEDDIPESYYEQEAMRKSVETSGKGSHYYSHHRAQAKDDYPDDEKDDNSHPSLATLRRKRESKSLRLSQKSYEDYKKMRESLESGTATGSNYHYDPRFSTNSSVGRKSVQRRSYYDDHDNENNDHDYMRGRDDEDEEEDEVSYRQSRGSRYGKCTDDVSLR
jgi:hypothetical protein